MHNANGCPVGLARPSCATRCVWQCSCPSAKVVEPARLHTLTQVGLMCIGSHMGGLPSHRVGMASVHACNHRQGPGVQVLSLHVKQQVHCMWSMFLVAVQCAAAPSSASACMKTLLLFCVICAAPAEGTFRPERIRSIAARFNLDTEAVLDNVSAGLCWPAAVLHMQHLPDALPPQPCHCWLMLHSACMSIAHTLPQACNMAPAAGPKPIGLVDDVLHPTGCAACCLVQIVVGRAHTVDGQMELLMTIGAKMVEEPYKLLVVDSIMALFRSALHWNSCGASVRMRMQFHLIASWHPWLPAATLAASGHYLTRSCSTRQLLVG